LQSADDPVDSVLTLDPDAGLFHCQQLYALQLIVVDKAGPHHDDLVTNQLAQFYCHGYLDVSEGGEVATPVPLPTGRLVTVSWRAGGWTMSGKMIETTMMTAIT